MAAAEVAADDVWLTLTSVEEPAGFGGEFGVLPDPREWGRLRFGVDQLVRVQLG